MPVVAQSGDDAVTAVARIYRKFGRLEARGRSAAYEVLAESVAGDAALVSFIASLPPDKRQPNLLFAAARYLLGAPPAIGSLRDLASQSRAELTALILARRTQTNEPARCAVLLPALAQLPQPLALIEAGASAGLNLLVDRYSYDYAGHRLAGLDPDAPTLRCEPRGPVPLPARIPAISWRAGLDLNPLDVTREDDVRWLSCLVWPHTSALWYAPAEQRERFARAVRGLGATWLSSEPPGVVPGTDGPARDGQTCVLARDGRGIALTESHGTWLRWLP